MCTPNSISSEFLFLNYKLSVKILKKIRSSADLTESRKEAIIPNFIVADFSLFNQDKLILSV